jgi:hypothetical protein
LSELARKYHDASPYAGDYTQEGSLDAYIKSLLASHNPARRDEASFPCVLGWMIDTIKALCHLHHSGGHAFLHRDLKPSNFMVFRNGVHDVTVKLGDFGTARELEHSAVASTAGNLFTRAPEVSDFGWVLLHCAVISQNLVFFTLQLQIASILQVASIPTGMAHIRTSLHGPSLCVASLTWLVLGFPFCVHFGGKVQVELRTVVSKASLLQLRGLLCQPSCTFGFLCRRRPRRLEAFRSPGSGIRGVTIW